MLLTSAHIVFTLGDVAQASNFRFQTLTLLFSFFPKLSFERIFCLDWSFFPKSMDTALHITFLPLCPAVLLQFLLLLQSERSLKHNTVNWDATWTQALECQNTKWRIQLEVEIKTRIYTRSTYNFSSSSPAPLAAIKLIFDLNLQCVSFYGTGQQKRRKTALGEVIRQR